MPDIVSVLGRRWKMILLLTAVATAVALLAALLAPKLYLGSTTALPANPLLADKARILNPNIEVLYTEVGTIDDLDKLEGTTKLDTLYRAAVDSFGLAVHYGLDTTQGDAAEKAVLVLKKNTSVHRTGFGELRINVWDKDRQMAAALANALMQRLNDIHKELQTENNRLVLQRLQTAYTLKMSQQNANGNQSSGDTSSPANNNGSRTTEERPVRMGHLQQYRQLIDEYELALKTAPNALLIVEAARPMPWPDKPKTVQIALFAFLGALLFSFLLAVLIESRKTKA